jgi:hypothetical protein
MVSEVGLAGLLMFVWLVISVIRNYQLKIQNTRENEHVLRVFILTSLATLLALGLIDHYPLTLQQGRLLLTLFIGLSLY